MPEAQTANYNLSWGDDNATATATPPQDDNYDVYLDKEEKAARDKLEQGVYNSVGRLSKIYQKKIEDLLRAQGASLAMTANSGDGAAAAQPLIKGKPPMWRGVRGILRWLWYGGHSNNPDYAGYDMQDYPEEPQQQNDSTIPSLYGYAMMKDRLGEAADQIAKRLGFEDYINENAETPDVEELIGQIRQIIQSYKTELIRTILRPSLLTVWKTGFDQGSAFAKRNGNGQETGAGQEDDSQSSNDQSAPSVLGRPDGQEVQDAEKETEEDSQSTTSAVEPSILGRPTEPVVNDDDDDDDDDDDVSGPKKDNEPDPPSVNGPAPGTGNDDDADGTSESKPKKTKKESIATVMERMTASASSASDVYASEELKQKYFGSGLHARTKIVKAVQEKFPLSLDDLNKPIERLIAGGVDDTDKLQALLAKLQKDLSLGEQEDLFADAALLYQYSKIKRNSSAEVINRFRRLMKPKVTTRQSSSFDDIDFGALAQSSGKSGNTRRVLPGGSPVERPKVQPKKPSFPEIEDGDGDGPSDEDDETKKAAKTKAAEKVSKKVQDADEEAEARKNSSSEPDEETAEEPTIEEGPESDWEDEQVEQWITDKMMGVYTNVDYEQTSQALMKLLSPWTEDPEIDDNEQDRRKMLASSKMQEYDPNANESYEQMIGRKWVKLLSADAQREYYKGLMREGRNIPYVLRQVVDKLPFEDKVAYYNRKLKEQITL